MAQASSTRAVARSTSSSEASARATEALYKSWAARSAPRSAATHAKFMLPTAEAGRNRFWVAAKRSTWASSSASDGS